MIEDPFKAMTREMDNRIVARGGRSIFGIAWGGHDSRVSLNVAQRYTRPVDLGVPEGKIPKPRKDKGVARIPQRWSGDELEKARIGYESPAKLATVAAELNTSSGRLSILATRHNWTARSRGPNRKRDEPTAKKGGFLD